MKKILKVTLTMFLVVMIFGCSSPKLLSCNEDQDGVHFTIKHTAGNWINPANYTDVITIPSGTKGAIDNKKIKAKNPNMGEFGFDGGFIEFRKGEWVDIRLLQYRRDFNIFSQYNANGKYTCP